MSIGKKIKGKNCVNREKYLIEQCKNKRVLHVGCTCYPAFFRLYENGDLLHIMLSSVTNELLGIDIVNDEITVLKNAGYSVEFMDAKNIDKLSSNYEFDVILLGDIIEHDSNPGLILEASKTVLSKNGLMIISVPNAFGIVRFLKTFFQYEQVHCDHVAYYSSGTLETLAEKHNLEVKNTCWYELDKSDKRFISKFSTSLESIITMFFPWLGEGCIVNLGFPE